MRRDPQAIYRTPQLVVTDQMRVMVAVLAIVLAMTLAIVAAMMI